MTWHLALFEGRIIAGMLQRNVNVTQIAVQIGRDRSTMHRKIEHEFWHDAEVPMPTG